MAAFVIKVHLDDPQADTFSFAAQKTMYGGKAIAAGDVAYIFDSENGGGRGLAARGRVTASRAVARIAGLARQTPRVDIEVARTGLATGSLGRRELKGHVAWDDGDPRTELNFKLYRQATDKIGGISDAAAAFLERFFAA